MAEEVRPDLGGRDPEHFSLLLPAAVNAQSMPTGKDDYVEVRQEAVRSQHQIVFSQAHTCAGTKRRWYGSLDFGGRLWIWEIFAAAVSISCMVVVSAALITCDGLPLTAWKLAISPNAVVSILTTVARSSMLLVVAECVSQQKWTYFHTAHRLKDFKLIDEASRGPLGAMKLVSTAGLRATVASLGACIIFFSLAMDPFAQQILHFHTEMVALPATIAKIGAANSFDSGSEYRYEPLGDLGDPVDKRYIVGDPAFDLITSMLRGILVPESHTDYECLTGNCTWSAFQSLGVCSECMETTAMDACNGGNLDPPNSNVNCMYQNVRPDPFGAQERLYVSADVDWSSTQCNSSEFARIAIVHHSERAADWLSEPAYLCSMSFCRNSYNQSRVTAGSIKDEAQSFERLVPFPDAPEPQDVNTKDLCPFRTEADAELDEPNSETFWVNWNDISVLGDEIERFFFTTLYTNLASNNWVAAALYTNNGGDIPKNMKAIATSMTNQIRRGPNATQVHGRVLSPEVFIAVSWAWLSLPASLVACSVAYLAYTAASSTQNEQSVWKSSVLATLFHGLHGLKSDESLLQKAASMQRVADKMQVILFHEDDGRIALVGLSQDDNKSL